LNYNSAKLLIEDLETKIPINDITFRGRIIWPILKYYLFFNLLKATSSAESKYEEITRQDPVFTPTFLSKLKFHLSQFISLPKYFFQQRREIKKLSSLNFHHDALFLDVTDEEYLDEINGRKYSRYISPYFEFFENQIPVFFISVWPKKTKFESKVPSSYYFDSSPFISFSRIIDFYRKKISKTSPSINKLDLVTNIMIERTNNSILNKEYLIDDLNDIMTYEKLWLKLLLKMKPKVVFMECYFGNINYYGLLAAAKKLKIKTVDIQHGTSSDQMYVGWQKSPVEGYNYLPDYYWCWSRHDVDLIKKTRESSKEFIPILGGNLWLYKNVNERITNKYTDQLTEQLNATKPDKTILVTLQHSIPISTMLIDAIKKSSLNWQWLIRFHPLDHMDANYRISYIEALSDSKNVEFKLTTEANLYALLKISNYHITHHSVVAMEAISFKIPTILLDNNFESIFDEFIRSKNFFIAQNSDDLLSKISEGLTINDKTFDYFKIEHSKEIAASQLNNLISETYSL
jgi:hypothetical protein